MHSESLEKTIYTTSCVVQSEENQNNIATHIGRTVTQHPQIDTYLLLSHMYICYKISQQINKTNNNNNDIIIITY